MRAPIPILLATLLLATAAVPTAATAQVSDGSSPLFPSKTEPEPTVSKPDDGSLGTLSIVVIALGGISILGGITWAIVRDARRNAPLEDTEERDRSRSEREAEHRRRKQSARRKGKAQKQARRANRPH